MNKESRGHTQDGHQAKGALSHTTYSLDLNALVHYSMIAEETFMGLKVVCTDDELRTGNPAIVQTLQIARRPGLRRAH